MNEIQNILEITFPFVKKLLEDYGEFYPLATVCNISEKIEQIILEENEDNDFPKSTSVIGELKKELNSRKNEFLVIAIFYDVYLKESETDAIAIFIEHKVNNEAFTFYYPYTIKNNEIIFSESWKTVAKMEIFVK